MCWVFLTKYVLCFSFGLFALRKECGLFLISTGGTESALLQCGLKLINSQGRRSSPLLLCSGLGWELTAAAGMLSTTNTFAAARGTQDDLFVSSSN